MTGLARTAPLARTSGLTRTGPIRSAPVPRSPEEVHARRVVGARSNGRCEACQQRATDWSHRLAEGQGGQYQPCNGTALCRRCHSWAEAHPTWADECGLHVPSWGDPATARVWLQPATAWPMWTYLDDEGLYVACDTDDPPPEHYPVPIRVAGVPAFPALPVPATPRDRSVTRVRAVSDDQGTPRHPEEAPR